MQCRREGAEFKLLCEGSTAILIGRCNPRHPLKKVFVGYQSIFEVPCGEKQAECCRGYQKVLTKVPEAFCRYYAKRSFCEVQGGGHI